MDDGEARVVDVEVDAQECSMALDLALALDPELGPGLVLALVRAGTGVVLAVEDLERIQAGSDPDVKKIHQEVVGAAAVLSP